AKLTMRLTPKMSERPTATRKSDEASAIPFRNCTKKPVMADRPVPPLQATPAPERGSVDRCRAPLANLFGRGQHGGAVDIAHVGHDALAVNDVERTHKGPHGGLMVFRTILDAPEGGIHFQPAEGLD